MNPLKKLAGQTAIYGLPSILGRFLNYLLTPLYTNIFGKVDFGIITEMYSYTAFLVVLLIYGMETGYFRFASRLDDKEKVYSTSWLSILFTTGLFLLFTNLFADNIANYLQYPDYPQYVIWFAFIIGLDVLSTIPLSRLRIENKAKTFAFVNLLSIATNIGLNVFFLYYCYNIVEDGRSNFLTDTFYNHDVGIGYVFIANLIASAVKLLVLLPLTIKVKFNYSWSLLKEMIKYSYPIMFGGLGLVINETLDRVLLKWVLLKDHTMEYTMGEVGVYGACYKLAIVMMMFVTAYRFAAEPFFFSNEKEKDAKKVYARIMKFFVIICTFIFLSVTLFLDVFKYFIRKEVFWEGLDVVPILLMAYVFYGIFYNLSVWYKLSGKTKYSAILFGLGALITIVINLVGIPKFGYMASAWATFFCYGCITVLSYFLGQKHYKINYPIRKILFYLGLTVVIFMIDRYALAPINGTWVYALKGIIILLYLGIIYSIERPKKVVI